MIAVEVETMAEELMTANPVSIAESLTAREARDFLIAKAISGAPVIDGAGRPVGVVSRSDLFIHDCERPARRFSQRWDTIDADESDAPLQRWEMNEPAVGGGPDTLVREVMTEGVFSVGRHAPIERVIGDMCELNVHRLFVVDASGVLVGVISAMDVLRYLSQRFRDRGDLR